MPIRSRCRSVVLCYTRYTDSSGAMKQPWLPKQGTWAVPLFLLPLTLQQAQVPTSKNVSTAQLRLPHSTQQPLQRCRKSPARKSNHPRKIGCSAFTWHPRAKLKMLRGTQEFPFPSLGTKLHSCHCHQAPAESPVQRYFDFSMLRFRTRKKPGLKLNNDDAMVGNFVMWSWSLPWSSIPTYMAWKNSYPFWLWSSKNWKLENLQSLPAWHTSFWRSLGKRRNIMEGFLERRPSWGYVAGNFPDKDDDILIIRVAWKLCQSERQFHYWKRRYQILTSVFSNNQVPHRLPGAHNASPSTWAKWTETCTEFELFHWQTKNSNAPNFQWFRPAQHCIGDPNWQPFYSICLQIWIRTSWETLASALQLNRFISTKLFTTMFLPMKTTTHRVSSPFSHPSKKISVQPNSCKKQQNIRILNALDCHQKCNGVGKVRKPQSRTRSPNLIACPKTPKVPGGKNKQETTKGSKVTTPSTLARKKMYPIDIDIKIAG